jgi:Ca2+-binding RTX toxin-like protein
MSSVFGGMKPRIRTTSPRIAAVAIAAGVAAFALPTAANAAVTPTVTGGTALTLASDAASDNITLTVNGAGLITHNLPSGGANVVEDSTDFDAAPGKQQLPSNGSVTLTVNGGDGNDNINVQAPSFDGTPQINGGEGDDTIVGSAAIDAIDGGGGNDRITAFRGNETIHGGAGNDVIIWNNGDGNDLNEGDAGVDETLIVEGTADDGNVVNQNGAITHFERVSGAGGFSVDSNAMEKLSLQSFSGNDTLATSPGVPLGMSIDAGPGDDTITTGDGADRILGDRGNDTLNGAGGDDTLVWTNGDGNDVMNGDAGTDTIENDLGAADDVSSFKVENGRIRYDRINAPFNLSVASSEVFELNSFGGNDTMTVEPGVTIPIVANGGSGDDTLRGGASNDVLDGGDGNDSIEMRDGQADLAKGGAGTDSAVADAATIDAVAADVEAVDRPVVAPAPGAGAATLAKTAKVKKGVATLKVSCPAGTSGCEGSVSLFSKKTIKAGELKAALILGRKSFTVGAGQSKSIKVKLASGSAQLAKKKKLAVTARVFNRGANELSSKVTLSF